MSQFFSPTIQVVTFCLGGWCMLGVFLLPPFTGLGHECQDFLSLCDEMHMCTDQTLVCTLIQELQHMESEPMLTPREKILSTRDSEEGQTCYNEPNTLPTELFPPNFCWDNKQERKTTEMVIVWGNFWCAVLVKNPVCWQCMCSSLFEMLMMSRLFLVYCYFSERRQWAGEVWKGTDCPGSAYYAAFCASQAKERCKNGDVWCVCF